MMVTKDTKGREAIFCVRFVCGRQCSFRTASPFFSAAWGKGRTSGVTASSRTPPWLLQDGNVACEETFLLRQTHALQQINISWIRTIAIHWPDNLDDLQALRFFRISVRLTQSVINGKRPLC